MAEKKISPEMRQFELPGFSAGGLRILSLRIQSLPDGTREGIIAFSYGGIKTIAHFPIGRHETPHSALTEYLAQKGVTD